MNAALVQITTRDLDIFRKLNATGWLTTPQLLHYFFPGKSLNAVCKRLRKLIKGNYLAATRISSTEHNFYRLGGRGRQLLLAQPGAVEDAISIPTQLPRKLRHFTALNDVRLAFETGLAAPSVQVPYFFSERELASKSSYVRETVGDWITLFQTYGIVPDGLAKVAVMRDGVLQEMNLCLEYDGGTEHANFYGRTKIQQYTALLTRHQERVGDMKVLTIAPRIKRLISLMRQAAYYQSPQHVFYFGLLEKLARPQWGNLPFLLDPYDFFLPVKQGTQMRVIELEMQDNSLPKHALLHLPASSPDRASSRGESI